MVAIVVWILELLFMGVCAWREPNAIIYNNMIGGMLFSVFAWIPAIMVDTLWKG